MHPIQVFNDPIQINPNEVQVLNAPIQIDPNERPRRLYIAEMAEMKEILEKYKYTYDDATALLFIEPFEDCNKYIKEHANPAEGFKTFIQVLQLIFTRNNLDKESVLGNDKETYGKKSLDLYFDSCPIQYKKRSPIHPEVDKEFKYEPHHLVREIAKWLEDRNALPVYPEIEKKWKKWDMKQKMEAMNLKLGRGRNDNENRIFQQLGDINENMQRAQELQNDTIEIYRRAILYIDNETKAREYILGQLMDRIKILNKECEDLKQKNIEIAKQNEFIGGQIEQAKRETKELENTIAKVERAIKEREKGWLEALVVTIVVIGASIYIKQVMGKKVVPVKRGLGFGVDVLDILENLFN